MHTILCYQGDPTPQVANNLRSNIQVNIGDHGDDDDLHDHDDDYDDHDDHPIGKLNARKHLEGTGGKREQGRASRLLLRNDHHHDDHYHDHDGDGDDDHDDHHHDHYGDGDGDDENGFPANSHPPKCHYGGKFPLGV